VVVPDHRAEEFACPAFVACSIPRRCSASPLTLGLGSTAFAAGTITGADIKDGTVTTVDIHDGS
jgi:hypothetical protein